MGIFRRGREHNAAVVYVFLRQADGCAYYSAVCRCGWFAEPVDATYPDREIERRMAAAAVAHDPHADTSVGFPLDDPP